MKCCPFFQQIVNVSLLLISMNHRKCIKSQPGIIQLTYKLTSKAMNVDTTLI